MYVPSISKPILFILQCKTTVWQWSTMGHFLIEKKLLRDKHKLQGQGLRETLKKGKKINTLSPLNSSFHIRYLSCSQVDLNRICSNIILCENESKVLSAWEPFCFFPLMNITRWHIGRYALCRINWYERDLSVTFTSTGFPFSVCPYYPFQRKVCLVTR